MSDMALKLQTLWPEIVMMLGAFATMIMGLSGLEFVRRITFHVSVATLALATVLAAFSPNMGIEQLAPMSLFLKVAIGLIGIVLLFVIVEMHDEQTDPKHPRKFDPADTSRGEFYGFFLLSLGGAMLCAGADDLVWLFLALELTSLPTYVMVVSSRQHLRAPEAAVKYFFLGAFAAGIFLYGFALLYGATGTTQFAQMQQVFAEQGIGTLATVGLVLAILGLCFKIAAFPMHFYAPDVYQGAGTPVATFLAFTPKVAGFAGLILLMNAVGWPTVEQAPGVIYLLAAIAVITMFAGNILALLQESVKRVLAYSSIAHSGYMILGLVAGPVLVAEGEPLARNGVAAILFYLVAYGTMNLGAFAVLGLLKRQGEEAETFEDLRGLAARRPAMAAVMAICVLSLTGIPPLVGFWGKVFLFGAAISAGFAWLAVLALVSTVIAAFYYLRIIKVCYLDTPSESPADIDRLPWRSYAAGISAVAVIVLSLLAAPLIEASRHAVTDFATIYAGEAEATPVQAEPETEAAEPATARADQ